MDIRPSPKISNTAFNNVAWLVNIGPPVSQRLVAAAPWDGSRNKRLVAVWVGRSARRPIVVPTVGCWVGNETMLKIYADFNARTNGDACFVLFYRDVALGTQIEELRLSKGDKIILYQDEDDFEVTATLDIRYVDVLGRETWVAVPDWSTMVRK